MSTSPLQKHSFAGAFQLSDACIAAARMTSPLTILPGGSPGSVILQYMPPGRQKISPFVDGKPLEMDVNVTAEYADVFERANQELLARARAGTGDEPYTDFNHNDDAASSRPQRYFWGSDDPRKGGVLLETKLTASGKAGITKTGDTEPDYTRFSPQWVFHRETFEPLGLSVNQGAFVNRAAFKTIGKLPVVSAGEAGTTWAIGAAVGGAGEPRNADQAADAAMTKTAEAYIKSKNAHTYGVGHLLAHNALMDAARAHEYAAARFDGEGRPERAQQERALVAVHSEAANRHKALAEEKGETSATAGDLTSPVVRDAIAAGIVKAFGAAITKALAPLHQRADQLASAHSHWLDEPQAATATGRAGGFGFVAKAKQRAREENTSLAQAADALAREQPTLYKAYLASFRKPGAAEAATGAHPFLVKARATAQARGMNMQDAQELVASQDHNLYRNFLQSLEVSAKQARATGIASPSKVVEFTEAVQGLQAQGKSFEEALSIVGARRPDLCEAYRLAMWK